MLSAVETPKFVWYLMRGSGFVALVLLTLTVALGVVGVRRWHSARWPKLVTAGLHRNLSLLALVFLGIHVVTALLDSWIGLSWLGVVVPGLSAYRPLWVGLGVVASDLLLALVATSLLRRHVRYRSWRLVHYSAWLMWPLALFHALGSGTDAFSGVGLVTVGCCLALVGASVLWRLGTPARRTTPQREAARPTPRVVTGVSA